jgi:DNA-binding PadR family transcriptional regulator
MGELMQGDHRAQGFLPLNPRSLMVLLGLAEGRAHGYEIKKRAEERSRGKVNLDAGALYRTLAQFLADGLIEEVPQDPGEEAVDARRRYYRLTSLGKDVLGAEVARLAELVDFARARELVESPEGAR